MFTDTVRHIIRIKFKNDFKTVTGVPIEDDRINTSIIDIAKNINQLARSINGIPTEFIFNLDEMVVSEFEDGREKSVILPIIHISVTAPFLVSRKEKHATCLTFI